ncbi:MAG: hypothetical protein ABIH99_00690 [Candidatus Micrarchaeota archaeon]
MGFLSGLLESAKGFLSVPFNRNLALALLILGAFIYFFYQSPDLVPQQTMNGTTNVTMQFFYLPTCPHCHEQMSFNARMVQEYGINVVSYDISTETGRSNYSDVIAKHHLENEIPAGKAVVPLTIIGNNSFIGFDSSVEPKLENAIRGCALNCTTEQANSGASAHFITDIPLLGTVDLRTFSLPVLAIVLGLIDGFNPCAMWVLLYMISVIMTLGDKRRMWLIAGTFVFASGILYFLFMTAWLNAFLLLGYIRIITVIIGLIALGAGILNTKEYIETRGALTCKVTDESQKTKTMNAIDSVIHAPLNLATIIGIIILAFTINSIEFACSAALPAVFTQILALSNLSTIEHYLYIGIYNVAFMFNNVLIFGLAVFAVSSELGEKYAKYCKIVAGILMLGIGILLLFAPQMLR